MSTRGCPVSRWARSSNCHDHGSALRTVSFISGCVHTELLGGENTLSGRTIITRRLLVPQNVIITVYQLPHRERWGLPVGLPVCRQVVGGDVKTMESLRSGSCHQTYAISPTRSTISLTPTCQSSTLIACHLSFLVVVTHPSWRFSSLRSGHARGRKSYRSRRGRRFSLHARLRRWPGRVLEWPSRRDRP